MSLLSGLLAFTINNTIKPSKKGFKSDSMVFLEWNQMIFPVVANAILRLPETEVYPALLAPICNNWEKAPGLMENLLWGLLFVGLTPECEGRLVDVWHRVGDVVLSSEICILIEQMFEGRHKEYPRPSHILRSERDLDRHSQGLVTSPGDN